MARISQHSLSKSGKAGPLAFKPDLKEWTRACNLYAYKKQIAEHFDITYETFCAFIDRQRFEKENGRKSEFLDALTRERNAKRKQVLDKLMEFVDSGDVGSMIFATKTYGGLIEAKDLKHIELKKKELELKTKTYITSLAKEFQLSVEELQAFTDKHFCDKNLNDI